MLEYNAPCLDSLIILGTIVFVQKELIMTVDLALFKHIVDDGLALKKAAFKCVDTLLDICLDQVNPSSFIVPFLRSGLDDHYDVKMPCHLILSKLAVKCSAAVLTGFLLQQESPFTTETTIAPTTNRHLATRD
ncbi:Cullin-associated nedd8-dissociated protein [Thalictrum thalictroides]|uniref:Cullin-associated nedd8-dissociated protein n=1 Tax=Thalictrum thalictroides TaxID=46969 RepID=A0A7J6UWG5_THATH|nr:Cullin-associated nedd8-dissociated protein [Thalictrum thalictroides]